MFKKLKERVKRVIRTARQRARLQVEKARRLKGLKGTFRVVQTEVKVHRNPSSHFGKLGSGVFLRSSGEARHPHSSFYSDADRNNSEQVNSPERYNPSDRFNSDRYNPSDRFNSDRYPSSHGFNRNESVLLHMNPLVEISPVHTPERVRSMDTPAADLEDYSLPKASARPSTDHLHPMSRLTGNRLSVEHQPPDLMEVMKTHQLHVKVSKARRLISTQLAGSNPYCKVMVGDEQTRSNTLMGTCNPDWNEAFTFRGKVVADASCVCVFEVWSFDSWLNPDDFCGQAELDLKEVYQVHKGQLSMEKLTTPLTCTLTLYVLKSSGRKETGDFGELVVQIWATKEEEGKSVLTPCGGGTGVGVQLPSKDALYRCLRTKTLPSTIHNAMGTLYEEPCLVFIKLTIQGVVALINLNPRGLVTQTSAKSSKTAKAGASALAAESSSQTPTRLGKISEKVSSFVSKRPVKDSTTLKGSSTETAASGKVAMEDDSTFQSRPFNHSFTRVSTAMSGLSQDSDDGTSILDGSEIATTLGSTEASSLGLLTRLLQKRPTVPTFLMTPWRRLQADAAVKADAPHASRRRAGATSSPKLVYTTPNKDSPEPPFVSDADSVFEKGTTTAGTTPHMYMYCKVSYAKQRHVSKIRRFDCSTGSAKVNQEFVFCDTRPLLSRLVEIKVYATSSKTKAGNCIARFSMDMVPLLLTHMDADKAVGEEGLSEAVKKRGVLRNTAVAERFTLPVLQWPLEGQHAGAIQMHVGAADYDYRSEMFNVPLIHTSASNNTNNGLSSWGTSSSSVKSPSASHARSSSNASSIRPFANFFSAASTPPPGATTTASTPPSAATTATTPVAAATPVALATTMHESDRKVTTPSSSPPAASPARRRSLTSLESFKQSTASSWKGGKPTAKQQQPPSRKPPPNSSVVKRLLNKGMATTMGARTRMKGNVKAVGLRMEPVRAMPLDGKKNRVDQWLESSDNLLPGLPSMVPNDMFTRKSAPPDPLPSTTTLSQVERDLQQQQVDERASASTYLPQHFLDRTDAEQGGAMHGNRRDVLAPLSDTTGDRLASLSDSNLNLVTDAATDAAPVVSAVAEGAPSISQKATTGSRFSFNRRLGHFMNSDGSQVGSISTPRADCPASGPLSSSFSPPSATGLPPRPPSLSPPSASGLPPRAPHSSGLLPMLSTHSNTDTSASPPSWDFDRPPQAPSESGSPLNSPIRVESPSYASSFVSPMHVGLSSPPQEMYMGDVAGAVSVDLDATRSAGDGVFAMRSLSKQLSKASNAAWFWSSLVVGGTASKRLFLPQLGRSQHLRRGETTTTVLPILDVPGNGTLPPSPSYRSFQQLQERLIMSLTLMWLWILDWIIKPVQDMYENWKNPKPKNAGPRRIGNRSLVSSSGMKGSSGSSKFARSRAIRWPTSPNLETSLSNDLGSRKQSSTPTTALPADLETRDSRSPSEVGLSLASSTRSSPNESSIRLRRRLESLPSNSESVPGTLSPPAQTKPSLPSVRWDTLRRSPRHLAYSPSGVPSSRDTASSSVRAELQASQKGAAKASAPQPKGSLPIAFINLKLEIMNLTVPNVYFFLVYRLGPQWVKTTMRKSCDPSPVNWELRMGVYQPSETFMACVFFHKSPKPKASEIKLFCRAKFHISSIPPNKTAHRELYVAQTTAGGEDAATAPSMALERGKYHMHMKLSMQLVSPDLKELALAYKRPLHPPSWYTLKMDEHEAIIQKLHKKAIGRWLEASNPPFNHSCVKAMLMNPRDKFDLGELKRNLKRVKASIAHVGKIPGYLHEVMSWQYPLSSAFAIAVFVTFCFFPSVVVAALLAWTALGALGKQHMIGGVAEYKDGVDDDDDDDDDDAPAKGKVAALKRQYEGVIAVALFVQNLLDDIATITERIGALFTWQDPVATAIFVAICITCSYLIYILGLGFVLAAAGVYVLRPPKWRDPEPTPPEAFYSHLPARRNIKFAPHIQASNYIE